jgi:hypothetical protein
MGLIPVNFGPADLSGLKTKDVITWKKDQLEHSCRFGQQHNILRKYHKLAHAAIRKDGLSKSTENTP